MRVEKTERGFEIIRFEDHNGYPCHLQQSSLANYEPPGSSAIWLGRQDNPAHLELNQVRKIVKHLQNWLGNGSFENGEKAGG